MFHRCEIGMGASQFMKTMLVRNRLARLARLAGLAGLLLCPLFTFAQAKRVVIVKVDGLSSALVDRFARQMDPRTGKSRLPWIYHLFYENGTRLENFYTRGISLSAPSWSLLNTGQHL